MAQPNACLTSCADDVGLDNLAGEDSLHSIQPDYLVVQPISQYRVHQCLEWCHDPVFFSAVGKGHTSTTPGTLRFSLSGFALEAVMFFPVVPLSGQPDARQQSFIGSPERQAFSGNGSETGVTSEASKSIILLVLFVIMTVGEHSQLSKERELRFLDMNDAAMCTIVIPWYPQAELARVYFVFVFFISFFFFATFTNARKVRASVLLVVRHSHPIFLAVLVDTLLRLLVNV